MSFRIGIDARKWSDYGIGTYVQNLVRSLAQIDDENRYFIISGARHHMEIAELPENFRFVQANAGGYTLREQTSIPWRIFRRRLDLFHATHYVLPYLVPSKTVVSIHDIIHLLFPQFLPNRFAFFYAQRMVRHSLARGDRIITDSQNTKTDLLATFPVDGRKIRVVYLGVAERFRARVAPEAIAETLDRFDVAKPYALFVGNPKPHKNLDNVLRAFARALALQTFEGDLVCVGAGPEQSEKIRHAADRLGLAGRLHVLGRVPSADLPAIYQGARLFVYPTLYEGFGFPVVEAMASGTPVITSNTSALKEIAEGYADLVNPLDVEAMAEAIVHSMTDAEHRGALRKLGERRAADFTWEATAKKTQAIYQRVLGAPNHDPA